MSPIVAPRERLLDQVRAAPDRTARPRAAVVLPRAEVPAVFAFAFAAYALLGLYTTLGLKIVLGDAESRLAHAYFVLWNAPPKLTAIGFYWPPLQTLVLIPLAVVRPFATSLAALPVASALFAAAMLATLDRALSLAEHVPRWLRWSILAAVGLNPMVLYFAVNGMGESLYLFLLTAGLVFFVRWAREPRWQDLCAAGVAFGLGVLARYEVAVWLVLVGVACVALLVRRRMSPQRIEASVLALLVPAVYGIVLWAYVNWQLTGDPTNFLAVANAIEEAPHGTLGGFARQTAAIQLQLFPFAVLVAVAAAWRGVRRRDVVAGALAAAVVVNAFVTIAFATHTREDVPLLLRYNMRAIPVAVVAAAWLLARAPRPRQLALGVAVLVALGASTVATASIMRTNRHQLGERAFLDALATGRSQDGRPGPYGPGLSVADQRDMAGWIRARIDARNSILADDSQSFGVILADGDPGRYLDRIDFGDRRWSRVRDHPRGQVRYLLVKRGATLARNRIFYDRILDRYPSLGSEGPPPAFLRLAHANGSFALYRVTRPPH